MKKVFGLSWPGLLFLSLSHAVFAQVDFSTSSSYLYQSIDNNVSNINRMNDDIIRSNNSYSSSGGGGGGGGSAPPDYIAIAFSSSTGEHGFAYKQSSKDDAYAAAVKICGQADCQPLYWAKNQCLAVVFGDGSPYIAAHPEAHFAVTQAKFECEASAKQCKDETFYCPSYDKPKRFKMKLGEGLERLRQSSRVWIGKPIVDRIKKSEALPKQYMTTESRASKTGGLIYTMFIHENPNSPMPGSGIISFVSNPQGVIIGWSMTWNGIKACSEALNETFCTK